jgi:hypothetical protein
VGKGHHGEGGRLALAVGHGREGGRHRAEDEQELRVSDAW